MEISVMKKLIGNYPKIIFEEESREILNYLENRN